MDIYLIIVIALFILAALDLMVGVSNDAVNFLNSAIGSKVASIRVILAVATIGILMGSLFSSGIMEVARKGIFNPQHFTYENIMILFLAVMITDIILLDLFNTLGMPTSTTVSIVFELLGSATMIALLFAIQQGESLAEFGKYINASSAMKIISGIFLSILVAFVIGAIAQFLSRMLFTFQYERNLKRFGPFFSGLALTAICYFLIIKGMKGTSLGDSHLFHLMKDNLLQVVGIMFLSWSLITFLLMRLFKVNPLRVIVLAGTFSLAMAFAGNDLVNFIGVPIAAFMSFQYAATQAVDPSELYMGYLSQKLVAPNYQLILAGAIMAVTLWFSSKARKVTETEVNLGRQDEGDERFAPNLFSRVIVKSALRMGNILESVTPSALSGSINKSYNGGGTAKATPDAHASFDLIRASVNLVIASVLIALATTKKMPLSTTYVSFMVAMGTSLADRAWGRESAVYRVAGVLSVISGWFLTAIIAFFSAAFFAMLLFYFRMPAVFALMALAAYALYSSQIRFKSRVEADKDKAEVIDFKADPNELKRQSREFVAQAVVQVKDAYWMALDGLNTDDATILKSADERMKRLIRRSRSYRAKSINAIRDLDEAFLDVGRLILYSSDHVIDMTESTELLTTQSRDYLLNLHPPLNGEVKSLLRELQQAMSDYLDAVATKIAQGNGFTWEEIAAQRNVLRNFINENLDLHTVKLNRDQIRLKEGLLLSEIFFQSRDIMSLSMRILNLYSMQDA